ncbi:MAG: DUF2997 domain-containing protein [Candidatus Sericytochromatia bacterium]|nr:DUF2997 domain-containing protein [Candidatus Sericytochromatia bacterium]
MEELKVIISPNGEVSFEVQGVTGDACLALTQRLEAGLGEVIERQLKPEYYQSAHDAAHLWNQQ